MRTDNAELMNCRHTADDRKDHRLIHCPPAWRCWRGYSAITTVQSYCDMRIDHQPGYIAARSRQPTHRPALYHDEW